MINDAINSMRALFLTTVVILLLWFLSYPSAVSKLQLYSDLCDLHAWLTLRDGMTPYTEAIFEFKPDTTIDSYVQIYESGDGAYQEVKEPLGLDVVWPDVQQLTVTLIPARHYQINDPHLTEFARIYRVKVKPRSALPFGKYFVVFLRGIGTKVVPTNDRLFIHNSSLSLRQVTQAAHEGHRPIDAGRLQPYLLKYGSKQGLAELEINSESLSKLRSEMDPRTPEGGVQLFGLRLSVQMFYSTIGLVLAAIAFTMLGPMLTIKSADITKCTHTWIFALPHRRNLWGSLLELLILAITILWVFSPLVVLILQGQGDTEALSGPILLFGKFGLGLAFIIQLIAAWQLRWVRLNRRL